MRIAGSAVTLTSQHELVASLTKTENFRVWGNVPPNRSGAAETGYK
jgi:hypothetical protein